MARAEALAGVRLATLAHHLNTPIPAQLRHAKGWVGQILEAWLGADAASLAEPDFQQLGIELKSLPIGANGQPRESTYVCTVPLEDGIDTPWEQSWLRRKLAKVLWFPVEANPHLPVADRRLGRPLLWQPDSEEIALLQRDWEDLTDAICHGEIDQITAHWGSVLQIRPKAANSRVVVSVATADGTTLHANPRGFYLRPTFTQAILQRHFSR